MKSLILITKCDIMYEVCKENWDADKLPGVERVKDWKLVLTYQKACDCIYKPSSGYPLRW